MGVGGGERPDVRRIAGPKNTGRWQPKLPWGLRRRKGGPGLDRGFPKDQVYLLHDKAEQNRYRPFRANIEKQLDLVLGMADKDDLVIVSFSGHGVQLEGKSYFCPLDARLEKLKATSIPLDEVYDRLSGDRPCTTARNNGTSQRKPSDWKIRMIIPQAYHDLLNKSTCVENINVSAVGLAKQRAEDHLP